MAVGTKLITAEELLRMPNMRHVELIDGEIRKMSPAGGTHGWIAAILTGSLVNYVRERGLGIVTTAEAGFRIRHDPDTVYAPDVAFVRKERWTNPDGFFDGPPDLAIEVISRSDTYTEVNTKVLDWLQSGVQIVIVIDPRKQSAAIRSRSNTVDLDINGTLHAGDVIPGWQLPMRDLFVS